ncbi:MAG TPA: RagB/SusD family nutrient uptake outer membrane protein [Ohtaekwangia sp.]
MKHIYIIALSLGMVLSSCSEDFLDVESETEVFDNNFYKTVADAEMALIGCYDGYQRTSSNGNLSFYVVSEVLSDNTFGGTGNTDGRGYQALDRFSKAESPSDNNLFNGTWSDYYAGIFRCNTLLSKLDGVAFESETTTRNRIEGETRFLRAIMYFDMVRLFERVPLLTVPTDDNVPQADAADTYKLIVEDLKYAAENIPADAYPKANAAQNDGRITQYAAKALLARVYLFYKGYYGNDTGLGVTSAEVLAGLEDVISSGEFELVEEFKSLWPGASYLPDDDNTLDVSGYAGEGNSEIVFAQKFNSTQDYNGNSDGNRWLVMMGMRNTNYSPYGKGWGACTVNPRLVAEFSNDDDRKVASIIDIEGEGVADFDLGDQREYTGYTNKKYTPTALPDGTSNTGGGNDFQISQDQDFVVIRYADVLLMAAELGAPTAQAYYDEVRTRSGLTARPVTQANILEERKFEFAFEGIRYWDLLRQGLSTAASTIAQTQEVLSGEVEDEVVIEEADILSTRGFMQIPNTQITLSNGVLVQNDGWE